VTCGPIRSGDEYRKFLDNIREHGRVVLISLTGPGADVLPWASSSCTHPRGVKCSGTLGCRVVGTYAFGWNMTASARYARLWKAATLSANRLVKSQGYNGRPIARVAVVWALQKRGVWHVHEALPAASPVELAWSRQVVRFIDNVRKREQRMPGRERWLLLDLERQFGTPLKGFYGFGTIDRNPLRQGAAAAAYATEATAASYLARNIAGYLSDNISAESAVGRRLLSYVSRRLTTTTGVTIRNLRRSRFIFVCLRDSLPLPDWSPEELEICSRILGLSPVAARAP
jgi:hypothetical protein